MNLRHLPELIDGLPDFCGAEAEVQEVTRSRQPVFLPETNLHLDRLQATFAVALHMHQPLIPAGGSDLRTADTISNLDAMMRNPGSGDNYNATVFADCYGRTGDIIAGPGPRRPQPAHHARLLRRAAVRPAQDGPRRCPRTPAPITCDQHLRKYVEWLGTMWGHAVASSTPLPDLKLHMRAWQQQFAAIFGWDALARVRGFSPPEMHLPNHPDAAFEYVKALKECGYRWLLVQEHTVETPEGARLGGPAPAAPPGGAQFARRGSCHRRHHQDAGLGHQAGGPDAALSTRRRGFSARRSAASAFRPSSRRSATARTAAS